MLRRYSPVTFVSQPKQTQWRDGWEVVLAYENEGNGPFVVDLSHRGKWDIQNADLAHIQPMAVDIPDAAGKCVISHGILVNRLNQTQATVWQLSGETAEIPDVQAYTDVTDASALLAFIGQPIFSIMEKITHLDLGDPGRHPPFLIQGPVLHVPCQVVVLDNDVVLMAFSRGYAPSMVEAILYAGSDWGLRPAGELVFNESIQRLI